jgi:hypothetical protein
MYNQLTQYKRTGDFNHVKKGELIIALFYEALKNIRHGNPADESGRLR